MNLIAAAGRLAESAPVPDMLTAAGIGLMVGSSRRKLAQASSIAEAEFADGMSRRPVAEFASAANAQHYEVPAEFFAAVLGPRRKYSCCYYDRDSRDLAVAEERSLALTLQHADLADGQDILELGCGWGSLSLYLAERFPAARIVAVSNSHGQRRHIQGEAQARGLSNLTVITSDMNEFDPRARFDRVVSVEMFEHMANWPALLARLRDWLNPEGRLFLHVFSHCRTPYRFDHGDSADWIAQHFFTGGIMPSHGLIRHFGDLFRVEREWRWSGEHYRRTARDWLANYDRNIAAIRPILRRVYGAEAPLWERRWRLFFLATAGLFGHRGGEEWGVSHHLLAPA